MLEDEASRACRSAMFVGAWSVVAMLIVVVDLVADHSLIDVIRRLRHPRPPMTSTSPIIAAIPKSLA